jgi:predicted CXXCH cytochrome family protein
VDRVQGRQFLHGPVAANQCAACHEPHFSGHSELLVEEGRELCLTCHVTVAKQLSDRSQVHAPVLDGCQTCHDPHAAENDALLPSDPVTLCTSCHEDIGEKLDSAVTPHAAVVTERACLNCHDPHASPNPRLLRETTAKLCFECHDRVLERPDGSKIANIKALVEEKRNLHGPVAQSNCVACHEIHGSKHARLLTDRYSDRQYQTFTPGAYEMCFSCHDRQAVLLEETNAVTAFRNGELNLHFVHVNRERGRSCSLCHDSHAADADHNIRSEVPFGPGGWMLPISWSRAPNGGSCTAACHATYSYDRVEPVANPLPNSKRPPNASTEQ